MKILAEIGDIKRFGNANKLAQFAGIAPLKHKIEAERQGRMMKMQDISVSFRIAVNANKEKIIEILKKHKDTYVVSLEGKK